MVTLAAQAFCYLVRIEWLLHQPKRKRLQKVLRTLSVAVAGRSEATPAQLCKAVDLACLIYFKTVMCLQRSAATTMLLRRHGFPAQLVIGARVLPFRSHAWVELDGSVVNDKSYVANVYRELDRC